MAAVGVGAEEERPKVTVRGSSDGRCATFAIEQEDHTLANALRYTLMRDRNTEFCGYSIPHPSEQCAHVRVQARPGSGATAAAVVEAGLHTLTAVCDHIAATFADALAEQEGSA